MGERRGIGIPVGDETGEYGGIRGYCPKAEGTQITKTCK